jgi:hypothetical protein
VLYHHASGLCTVEFRACVRMNHSETRIFEIVRGEGGECSEPSPIATVFTDQNRVDHHGIFFTIHCGTSCDATPSTCSSCKSHWKQHRYTFLTLVFRVRAITPYGRISHEMETPARECGRFVAFESQQTNHSSSVGVSSHQQYVG